MSPRLSLAIFRHNLRLLAQDPSGMIALVLMPLVMMVFLKPTYELVLQREGYAEANGAEQAVPGLAVLFSFFWVGIVGYGFFREYGWGTWERLRASPASTLDVMVGKLLPPLLAIAVQFVLLFTLGGVIFDMDVRGSVLALGMLLVALSVTVVTATMMLVALTRNYSQLEAFSYFAAMVLGGLGGGLAPVEVLPQWAQDIAPGTPTYWAIEGLRGVVLDGDGVGDALRPTAFVLAFAVGFGVIAALKFRTTDTKVLDT